MKSTRAQGVSRRAVLGGLAASAGVIAAACSTSGGRAEGGGDAAQSLGDAGETTFSDADYAPLKGARVGVVGINLQGPTVARAVAVMNDLSAKHGFTLEAVSAEFDLLRANDTMRVWADQGLDAIVVANTEVENLGEGLSAAQDKGVPVAGFYCGWAPGMAFDVQSNEWISGNRCATYIRQRLQAVGGSKGIAIFGYTPLSNLRQRELCVKTQADYYGIPVLFRHEVNADSSVPDIQNRTGDLLTKYARDGELGAIFVGWDQGGFAADSALAAAGRGDIFVVSIDGDEANLESIRQGGPQGATVVNDMPTVAQVVLTQLAKIRGGGEPPATKELFVDAPLVTAENIPPRGIPGGSGLSIYYAG